MMLLPTPSHLHTLLMILVLNLKVMLLLIGTLILSCVSNNFILYHLAVNNFGLLVG